MRIFLIFVLLAACSTTLPPHAEVSLSIPEGEVLDAGKETEPKPKKSPAKRTVAKEATPKEAAPAVEILPPCHVDADDRRTAIVQKLECLQETANKSPKP